jgi:hypothetical protein
MLGRIVIRLSNDIGMGELARMGDEEISLSEPDMR